MGSDSPRTLVDEVERHLRALLRDVMCGYLDPDLAAVADDLLLGSVLPGGRSPWSRSRVRAPEVGPAAPASPQLRPEPECEPAPSPPAAEWTEIDEERARLDDPAFWSAPA